MQVEVIEKPTVRPTKKRGGLTSDVVTLSKSDLDRMLAPPLVMTPEDVAAANKAALATRDQAQAVSRVRKERMLRLAEEAQKNAPPTETVLLKAQADGALLSRAQALLLEEKDEVKRMNQMILYSKCATIRDAQIEEKRQMMQVSSCGLTPFLPSACSCWSAQPSTVHFRVPLKRMALKLQLFSLPCRRTRTRCASRT